MFRGADRKYKPGRDLALFVLGVILTAGFGTCLAAEPSHRAGLWEGFLSANYLNGETVDFDGGASAEIDGDMGWIFGFGYNFNENLALDMELGWNSVSYTGTRVAQNPPPATETYGGWLDTTSTRFNLTYNFMAKTFTPFVSANIGWAWIDSNIPSAPPQTGCWWDPWWGYVCSGYQPTYAKSEFAYGAALGVRFDLKDNIFLRGIVGEQWVDVNNTNSTPSFTNYRFDFGMLFGN